MNFSTARFYVNSTLATVLVAMVGLLGSQSGLAAQSAPVLQVSSSDSPANSNASSDLYFLVQQLQQEVRELRGRVEELQYRVEQSKKQERDRYIDLDRRILELRKELDAKPSNPVSSATGENQPAGGVAPAISEPITPSYSGPICFRKSYRKISPTDSAVSGLPGDAENNAYNAAYGFIKQRKYDEAVNALHGFIKQYPESRLAANAYYWLGEVYLVIPKLEQARQSFFIVIGKYPRHRKAPDAFYKLGITYDRMGKKGEARKYLEQTISRFPQSASASLAKDYLEQI